MYAIFYLHLPKKLTFHVGKYTIVPWMVWVIGIPRYHGMRARDFLYQSIQCSLEVVAWHLAMKNLRFENKNPEKKVRNKIKVQRKKFSICFADVTSQFIVHILGFALNWCHSHGDISWLRSGGICFCSPALFSFFPTMNSVCLRWCVTHSTMVNHHKTTMSIYFFFPSTQQANLSGFSSERFPSFGPRHFLGYGLRDGLGLRNAYARKMLGF